MTMIYLKNINTCFLKIPKTASTSLMWFLIRNCLQSGDLATSVDRYGILVPHHLTNHCQSILKDDYFRASMDQDYLIEKKIVPEDAHFIATIRNPYHRQASAYINFIQDGKSNNGFRPQTDFMHQGEWWCYDYIEWHITKFMEKHGFETKFPFPHMNETIQNHPIGKMADNFLTDSFKNFISNQYSKDFEIYERTRASVINKDTI